jgi:tRNA dimethylallyltransferase
LDLSTEQMKAATRQYAKRQIRWIRLKLIPALSNQNQLGKLYLLDGTDIARWSDDVVNPAMDVTANFLAGEKLRAPRELSDAANDFLTPERSFEFARRRDLWVRQECDLCHTVCVTEDQWQNHLKSRGHRRMIKKQTGDARSGRSPIPNSENRPM